MAVKKSGQLVLFRFPQTDLLPRKLRPALLIAPLPSGRHDWLVCMISTQITQAVPRVDEVININDADFAKTGLKNWQRDSPHEISRRFGFNLYRLNRPGFSSPLRRSEKTIGSQWIASS